MEWQTLLVTATVSTAGVIGTAVRAITAQRTVRDALREAAGTADQIMVRSGRHGPALQIRRRPDPGAAEPLAPETAHPRPRERR